MTDLFFSGYYEFLNILKVIPMYYHYWGIRIAFVISEVSYFHEHLHVLPLPGIRTSFVISEVSHSHEH